MEQNSEEIEDVEEIRSVEVIDEGHKLIYLCNFSAIGNQLTDLTWTQEDIQTGLTGLRGEIAEMNKSLLALENRVELKIEILLGDVEQVVQDSEDRTVDKILDGLAARDIRQLFAANVRQSVASIDTGLASSVSTPGTSTPATSTPATSTPVPTAKAVFRFPSNSKKVDGKKAGNDAKEEKDGSLAESLAELNNDLKKEVEEQKRKIKWLQDVVSKVE